MEKGLVQIYTGDGKGKTTAALGLAMRAAGRGLSVFMVQFLKGRNYGEVESAKLLSDRFKVVQSGLDTFVRKGEASEEDPAWPAEGSSWQGTRSTAASTT